MKNAIPGPESLTLYFREGSSDKVYTARVEERSGGWAVTFAYGRRGSAMATGSKTQSPVPYEKAKSIFDKLIAEKTGKGYTPGEDGTAYKDTTLEARDSGVRVQLLNDVDESEVERLIKDEEWGMQEKHDGRRLVVRKDGEKIVGINRKGLIVALPEPIIAYMKAAKSDMTIDGEAVGDTLYAFDLLGLPDDMRGNSYMMRWTYLAALRPAGAVKLVPLAITAQAKRELIAKVRAARGEGVVFKRLTMPYKAGRPDKGGDQLKYKFYATGSFIVAKANAKRSVGLEVLTLGGQRIHIGNVTITPNKEVPAVGSVVEIRYLYCFRGGCLFQPTFLTVRDDIDVSDCTSKQIKYKADGDNEDGEG